MVSWIGSLSPLLAVFVFITAAGAYLVSLARTERAGSQRSKTPVSAVAPDRDAISALDELLAGAPPIPLTDWVRVERSEVAPLVNAIRVAAQGSALSGEADALVRAVLGGRKVPFSDQLRVDRRQAQRLLAELRSG